MGGLVESGISFREGLHGAGVVVRFMVLPVIGSPARLISTVHAFVVGTVAVAAEPALLRHAENESQIRE